MPKKDVYNSILVMDEPRGRRIDGYIDGTPKPGTVMQLKAATEPVHGRHTWEVYNQSADSERPQGPIVVLLEDHLQGKSIDTAYVSGTLGFLYFPLPGDELLMLLADVAGTTSDSHPIGEKLIVNDGDGKLLVTTGSPETEPFTLLETLAGLSADTLAHCMFTCY